MFEVRCLVADRRLADVLRLLKSLTLEPPVTIAVEEEVPGLLVAKENKRRPGELVNQAVDQARHTTKKIVGRELTELMLANGHVKHAYSYRLKQLVDDKVLKKTPRQGVYEVIK